MTSHVAERIADYLDGRLDAAGMRAFEAHVAECPDCAGDVRWARDFRDAATLQGLRHLTAERIVEIADRTHASATDVEEHHLQSCPSCERELSWARDVAAREAAGRADAHAVEPETGTRLDHRRASRWRWSLGRAVAAFAAAAAVFALVTLSKDRDHRISDLAVIQPLPVHITRGPVEPGSFEESKIRGLELYEARDFAGARDALRRAAALEPSNHEVALYLGTAELLLGQASEAVRIFASVVESAEDAIVRDEALWQLANAELARGGDQNAARTLREITSRDGRHRADAASLLEQLEERSR